MAEEVRAMPRYALTILLALAATVVVVLAVAPSPYFVMTPGGTYEVAPRLELPDGRREAMGRLAFTAVYVRPAGWPDVLHAAISREAALVPAEEALPHGMSQQEMNELNQRLIEESEAVAAAVALRAAGYPADVIGQGAEVVSVVEGMPAAAVLQRGDVILTADGQAVQTASDLVNLVLHHRPGETVELALRRGEEHLRVAVETRASVEEPGRPAVGAVIRTRGFGADLPFPVDVDTDPVGGASAGLILALGVFDAVTGGDLTRGRFVAGTGTINRDGQVGPIGGAAQKVIAAERDGATVFLVPEENAEEARSAARAILVVPVRDFEAAVRALCNLPPAPDAPPEPPAPCTPPLLRR
jgi:PDZ domain-containing protein